MRAAKHYSRRINTPNTRMQHTHSLKISDIYLPLREMLNHKEEMKQRHITER
jgi:hypothetical protein